MKAAQWSAPADGGVLPAPIAQTFLPQKTLLFPKGLFWLSGNLLKANSKQLQMALEG